MHRGGNAKRRNHAVPVLWPRECCAVGKQRIVLRDFDSRSAHAYRNRNIAGRRMGNEVLPVPIHCRPLNGRGRSETIHCRPRWQGLRLLRRDSRRQEIPLRDMPVGWWIPSPTPHERQTRHTARNIFVRCRSGSKRRRRSRTRGRHVSCVQNRRNENRRKSDAAAIAISGRIVPCPGQFSGIVAPSPMQPCRRSGRKHRFFSVRLGEVAHR